MTLPLYLDLPGQIPDLRLGLDGASFLLGAMLGVIGSRFRVRPIARLPYFALWAALLLATTMPEASARLVSDTSRADAAFLRWMDVALSFFEGAALIGLGMGRSRDAFGRRRWGVLVLIPLVNVLLFLAPSRRFIGPREHPRLPRLLTGRLAIPVGIAAIFIAGMAHALVQRHIEGQGIDGVFHASGQPRAASMPSAEKVSAIIEADGRAAAERAVARSWTTPLAVDDRTRIVQIAARSYGIRMTYVVDGEMALLPWKTRIALMRSSCLYPPFGPLIAAGSEILHDYRRPDGSRIGSVMVDGDICG